MNWDNYFLGICKEVGKNSKCHSRQIGAILVKHNIIISTGYNGPARNIPECRERYKSDPYLIDLVDENKLDGFYENKVCPRKALGFKSGEGLEWCNAVHAEKNCLLSAARMGIKTKGSTLYIDAEISPCTQCYSACIQAGIKEIVVVKNNIYDVTLEWCLGWNDIKIREFNLE